MSYSIGATGFAQSGAFVSSYTTSSFGTTTTGSTFCVALADGSTTSVTDSNGNTYTQAGVTSYFAAVISLWYCVNGNGGSNTTVTVSGTGTYYLTGTQFTEFIGLGAGSFDTCTTGNSTYSGTSLACSSITTTVANELVVNVFGTANYSSSGFTDSGGIWSIATSYQGIMATTWSAPTSTSTVNDTIYLTANDQIVAVAASFKPAGGGAAGGDNTETYSTHGLMFGLRAGTPLSRLRGTYGDTTFVPPNSFVDDGGQASPAPRRLLLGTPMSRLRSGVLGAVNTPPPFIDQSYGTPPHPVRPGTPFSRLRGVYGDAASAASTAQGSGVAIASGVALAAPSDTPALAGVSVSSGVGVAQEGALAAEAGISVSSSVALAGPTGAAALAAISVSSSVGVAGPSGAAALAGIAVASSLGVGAPSDTSALAGIAVSSSVGIANLTTIGSLAGSGIAVSSGVAVAAPSDAPAMAGVSVSSALAIAQIIASGSISGISVSSSVGIAIFTGAPSQTTTPYQVNMGGSFGMSLGHMGGSVLT